MGIKVMDNKKRLLFPAVWVVSFFLLLSCRSSRNSLPSFIPDGKQAAGSTLPAERKSSWLWDTPPADDNPVFLTISPRFVEREKEREVCLTEASVQGAQFFFVRGKARFIRQKTNTGIGYAANVEVSYDSKMAKSLRDKLSIMEEYQDDDGTYLITKLEDVSMGGVGFSTKMKAGRPEWIDSPPEIDGYLSAVGVAQRKRLISDSLKASDEKALEELLKMVALEIKSVHREKSVDKAGTAVSETTFEQAEAELKGFYILSRWRSPDQNTYYSLAVCRK
ncbi:MAG: LPP20 family lipoprotein [Spirochaetota bacterium]